MQEFQPITTHRNGLLFFCLENTARSQMAEGFARFIGPAEIQYYSAGARPGVIHPMTLKVMKEVGIDISSQVTKDISTLPLAHIATAIVLGTEEEVPNLPEEIRPVLWEITDPLATARNDDDLLYDFRAIRDEIRTAVSSLF